MTRESYSTFLLYTLSLSLPHLSRACYWIAQFQPTFSLYPFYFLHPVHPSRYNRWHSTHNIDTATRYRAVSSDSIRSGPTYLREYCCHPHTQLTSSILSSAPCNNPARGPTPVGDKNTLLQSMHGISLLLCNTTHTTLHTRPHSALLCHDCTLLSLYIPQTLFLFHVCIFVFYLFVGLFVGLFVFVFMCGMK